MKYLTRIACVIFAGTLCLMPPTVSAQAASAQSVVARQVQTYFMAMGKGDVASIERVLAPDYVVIGGDGKLESRAERVAWLRQHSASLVAITPSQVLVRSFGNAAVATGLVTIPADATGPAIEERFTQVWIQRNAQWFMVSGQITIVRK